MRPHRLRVTAFGPFPGTVDIDLDEVSGAGPFLLRGATGAGKTSLLDAVGYALFGRVPGSRGLKQLRSDHAPDGVRTSVELWATVGGRAVHVVRTPDQLRPRARGTGTTRDGASVSVRVAPDLAALEADEPVVRLSGVQEANDELARLVGMTHEQFLQVVLLPQGDFARFLRAKDDERADVLRALFDTRRFRQVEQHLRDQRDGARDVLAQAQARVDDAAHRVAAVAGPPAAGAEHDPPDHDRPQHDPPDDRQHDPPQHDPPEGDLPRWAGRLLEQAVAAADDAAAHAGAAAVAVRSARTGHAAVADRVRALAALLGAARTQARLLDRAPEVAALAEGLADADRAAGVVVLHDVHARSLDRLHAAQEAARTALARLADHGGTHPEGLDDDGPGLDGAALEGLDDDAVRRLAAAVDLLAHDAVVERTRLRSVGPDVVRHQEQLVALEGHRAAAVASRTALDQDRSVLEELPVRAAALRAQLDEDRAEASGLAAAQHEVERWTGLVAVAGRLARLVDEVAGAELDDIEARAAARRAEEHHDDLRRARLAGMSAELARGLVPGEPCTVCGATEHPAPAAGEAAPVGPDDEDAARTAAAEASAVAVAARTALADVAARRLAAQETLAAGAVPELVVAPGALLGGEALRAVRDALGGHVGLARGAVAAASAAAARCGTTTAELDRVRAEQEAAGERVTAAAARLAGCLAAVGSAEAEVARLATVLQEALGEDPGGRSPAARHADLLARADERAGLARTAADAVGTLVPAHEETVRSGAAALAGALAAGWATVAEALAAARPAPVRERDRREVASHERELHAADEAVRRGTAALAEAGVPLAGAPGAALVAEVSGLVATTAAEERALAAALGQAEAAHADAAAQDVRCGKVRDDLRRAVPRLLDALEATGPLRERAEAARALADLCGGSNERMVPLSTYVLAAHLQHVVEAANLRLHGMSEGRYALVHVEEGEDRRRRAGLGLAVVDAWTGRRRPAGTLSGGETFLASLALALGLADVVTAEAGGARIDALFVDEGFGTLDPDSLDRAMDVLDQLQEHGRMVGVVSHVGELRARLPRQVHVQAGRTGSTVQVLTG